MPSYKEISDGTINRNDKREKLLDELAKVSEEFDNEMYDMSEKIAELEEKLHDMQKLEDEVVLLRGSLRYYEDFPDPKTAEQELELESICKDLNSRW
jgi:hypothetical protein